MHLNIVSKFVQYKYRLTIIIIITIIIVINPFAPEGFLIDG